MSVDTPIYPVLAQTTVMSVLCMHGVFSFLQTKGVNMDHGLEYNKQKLLRLPQVLELLPIGKSSWWEGVRSGRYPPSIKLGPRTTAWKAQDIYDLIDRLSQATTIK